MTKDNDLKTYLETLTGKSVYSQQKSTSNNDCLVIKRLGTKRFRSHSGPITNLAMERFQIEVFNTDFDNCRSTTNTILDSIDANHTDFHASIVNNNWDLTDLETGLFWSIIDVYIA